MKKALIFIAALAAFVGCQKNGITPIETQETITFIAETEQGTKATLNELTFNWELGDKIGVWATKADDSKQLYSYTNKAEVAGPTGIFEGNSTASSYDFAIYPAADLGNYSDYFFKLPNTFTNYKSGQVVSPMISLVGEAIPNGDKQSYSGSLNFKHLCGMIKLSITGLPEGTTSVSWTNDGYYPINGKCDIIASKLNDAELLTAVDVMSAVTNGTSSKTTTFSFDALATRSDMVFYVPLLPGTYESGFTIKASNGVDEVTLGQSTKAQTVVRANVHKLSVDASSKSYPVKIIDVLTAGEASLNLSSSYGDFSYTSANNITYKGNACTQSSGVQLRAKTNSGLVVTNSGNIAKNVIINWADGQGDGNNLTFYGKNTPYTSAADLYAEETRGTSIGSLNYKEATSLALNESTDYQYIGILASGAIRMTSITIEWGEDTRTPLDAVTNLMADKVEETPNSIEVIWDSVTGAANYTVSISPADAEPQVVNDTECTFSGLKYSTEYTISIVANPTDAETNKPSDAVTTTATTGEAPELDPGTPVTISLTSFTTTSAEMDHVISYQANKGDAGTDPAINTNQIRIYQIGSGKTVGGNIKISAKTGYKITSITIGSDMDTKVKYEIDNSASHLPEAAASIAKGTTYTVDSINASSVTFHCYGTDKNSRLYVNNLSVTYIKE